MDYTPVIAVAVLVVVVAWEVYAVRKDGQSTWSELLHAIAKHRFVLVLVAWFIGYVMGHALAPMGE